MSMIGFAARPGTAVLPTCSMAATTEHFGDSLAQSLKESRPVGVVVHDDDRVRHR
jgi:hypothetical protein